MTKLPASALPEIVGVLIFVRLSVLVPDVPVPVLSEASTKLRAVGAFDVVSTVTASAVEVALVLFAGSIETTVKL